MTTGVLDAVVAAAGRAAAARARDGGVRALEREAASRQPNGEGFRRALAEPGIRVIAECKRRSPSRGILRADYDPAAIARAYETAGAAAISVLTEPTFFDGALEHLRAVRAAARVPLLRKDFIVTSFQLVEARAAGADAVLLIVAALEDRLLRQFVVEAQALGLAALVEAHSRRELDRAVQSGATIVGINSRDLRTLQVTSALFEDLAGALPSGATRVAESGLRNGEDLIRLRALGYDAFLIGERCMTAADPGGALRALIGPPEDRRP